VLTAGPIQEAGLDSWIAPYCGVSSILSRKRRLDVVLAVQPESLNDLNGVLLVGLQVSVPASRNARDAWAGVFTVSTDQSHWKQEPINPVLQFSGIPAFQ